MIHRTPSDPARYREFQEALEGETVPALARVASGLAAGAILAFIPVDFVFYPDQAASFAMLRVLCALAQLGAGHWLVRTHPTLALKTLAFVTGATLLVVTAATGGPTSPYYSGLLLLFVALPVVVPLNARAMVGILGVLVLGFASLPLLETGPLDARTFGLHTVFLALAGGIATVTAAALDGMRFADHERRREIERARDELAQLDDAKTRFTANVHHELRTPLTLMLAPLEGMRAGDYGPVAHEAERPLRTMHVNGKRLLKLINNLLDLAKLESAQFEVTRAPLSVPELLEEVVEGALPMAERKQIRLVCEARDDVPDCFADRAALDKVLVNLVGNALKFTDAGGEVGVGAAPAEGGLEVWVRDTGVGLAPDQLERVFDRFAQVDASATRRHEGTGIGLSLASELVELHGGRIWATSEGLGRGATMRFFLPLGEPDAALEGAAAALAGDPREVASAIEGVEAELGYETGSANRDEALRYIELDRSADKWEQRRDDARPEPPEALAADERPAIVVVDDNADMRELIAFILGRDFRVYTARHGREALELLPEAQPDLVVSDIMMPEMSGTELCEAIKADPATRDLPVMLVSSKGEDEMKVEGLERGADDYVTKPFHPRELLVRARSHAGLRRARRELAARAAELEQALGELQSAEVQLVQSERLAAVGELAAGIAHEVNNPVNYALNAVRALQSMLSEVQALTDRVATLDFEDPEKLAQQGPGLREALEAAGAAELAETLAELAEIAQGGLERTQGLVGDLRDFAAPGGGAKAAFDVAEGLRSTLQLMRHDLEVAGTEVTLALPEALSLVEGNAGNLNQVFLNLFKNASEAMGEGGGAVHVEARERADRLELRFRDSGPGVAPEIREQLFEPFFSTKPAGRGAGLGLSMCRKIAHAHGGGLELVEEGEPGACFLLTLPIARAQEVSR